MCRLYAATTIALLKFSASTVHFCPSRNFSSKIVLIVISKRLNQAPNTTLVWDRRHNSGAGPTAKR